MGLIKWMQMIKVQIAVIKLDRLPKMTQYKKEINLNQVQLTFFVLNHVGVLLHDEQAPVTFLHPAKQIEKKR